MLPSQLTPGVNHTVWFVPAADRAASKIAAQWPNRNRASAGNRWAAIYTQEAGRLSRTARPGL